MGISGLLPFVKKACRQGNLFEFKGKSIAVDVSCLLHRGIFGCAGDLARGNDTDFYIHYVRKYIDALLRLDCHVILVFDGEPLPAKKDINDARKERREKNIKLGEKLLKKGLKKEAHRAFQQGTTLTREIVKKTINVFRKISNVDVIVAPYEADAQIAYLLQNGLAYVAITEDSDLIVFGCERIIFKMETNGTCTIYEKSKLSLCVCTAIEKRFDFEIFRRICILAGCDYLQGGLQGVGLKRAELFFTKTSKNDLRIILPKLPFYLNMSNLKVDSAFIEEFIRAENTFLYQIVFDPISRKNVPLNEYSFSSFEKNELNVLNESEECIQEENESEECTQKECIQEEAVKNKFWYAGEISSPNKAFRHALGNFELSLAPVQDEFVLPLEIPKWSIWAGDAYLNHIKNKTNNKKEKFGAFVSENSPIKRKIINKSLNDSQANPISVSTTLKKRKIPFNDAKKKNNDFIVIEDENNCEDEDDALLIFKKTKKQRRSEPLYVKNSQNTLNASKNHYIKSMSNCGNGSSVTWNCNELLKIYGNKNTNLLKNECSIQTENNLENSKALINSDEILKNDKDKNNLSDLSSKLNPFIKETIKFDGENKNNLLNLNENGVETENIDMFSITEQINSNEVTTPIKTDSINNLTKFEKINQNSFRVGGLRKIRRPLNLLNDNKLSADSNNQNFLINSQNQSLANLSLNSPSQDIFYQKRKLSQQSLSSIDDENIIKVSKTEKSIQKTNKKELKKTNDNIIDNDLSKKLCEKNAIKKQNISPYFLNNKLTDLSKNSSSNYRPSGLRRRTIAVTTFPKII